MDKDVNSPNEQLLYIISQFVSPFSPLLVSLLSQETAAALLYGKHFLASSSLSNLKFHSSLLSLFIPFISRKSYLQLHLGQHAVLQL